MPIHRKNNHRTAIIVALLVAVLLVGGGVFGYKKYKDNNKTILNEDKTTSTAPSAQETFNSGDNRTVAPTTEEKGNAVVTDNQGQQTDIPDESLWSTSKTGEITVYTPQKDTVIRKGDVLSGESKLSIIYYRIIDDFSGMIAQGQLAVVNGKFSGTVSFATSATNGRIDIYGATDSGREFGNVEIPVKFR